jgi:hypothetical protein
LYSKPSVLGTSRALSCTKSVLDYAFVDHFSDHGPSFMFYKLCSLKNLDLWWKFPSTTADLNEVMILFVLNELVVSTIEFCCKRKCSLTIRKM